MQIPYGFLLVDDHFDNRFLLAKTLSRKFPGAVIQECQSSAAALAGIRRPELHAAIVHRTDDLDGLSLITKLRAANATIPILYISGYDHREKAFPAGATAFLNYDAWLRVGAAVEDMMRVGQSTPPFAKPELDGTKR